MWHGYCWVVLLCSISCSRDAVIRTAESGSSKNVISTFRDLVETTVSTSVYGPGFLSEAAEVFLMRLVSRSREPKQTEEMKIWLKRSAPRVLGDTINDCFITVVLRVWETNNGTSSWKSGILGNPSKNRWPVSVQAGLRSPPLMSKWTGVQQSRSQRMARGHSTVGRFIYARPRLARFFQNEEG